MPLRLGPTLPLVLALMLTALPGLAAPIAEQPGYGGHTPRFTPITNPDYSPSLPPVAPTGKSPAVAPVSLFGMNLYLTGLERSNAQASTLGTLAAQAGVKWSREELSWANLEPQAKGSFAWATYDTRLGYDATNAINVVGMLLTTPKWASTNPGAPDWYWWEPRNRQDYFDFVRAAVGRWKGQIHVWEIWNEPNYAATWNCVSPCDHAADYAVLLQGAYATIKQVDPTARVLIGGLYVHDTANEGMAFLNQVVADSGGAINFDALSIHTYMPDRVPEGMRPDSVVQNFQYRLNMVNAWIDAHGGHPSEIWITEDGRSTCNGCPYPWSESDQASMLARMYGIAAATPRVAQFDYFQFEDKFNTPSDLYGAMSIVRDDLTTKPAYSAYKTAAAQLDGATFSGTGPAMIPGNNPQQPDSSDFTGFDYRFTRGSAVLHMVWRVNDTATIAYPAETAQVDVVSRDGAVTRLTAAGGMVTLTVGPGPVYVVNVSCSARFNDVCPDYWAYTPIEYLASHGIVSGYNDGTFRPAGTATRAQFAKMIVTARGWAIVNPATPSFSDVPTGSTFYGAVETAKAHGSISGYNDGTFQPGNPVSRGQISKMIVSAFAWAVVNPATPSFSDVPAGSTFYGAIETAKVHAVISGYSDGTFRPTGSATRAQLSKMLYQSLIQ